MRAHELGVGGSSIGAVAAALALPKCPLCIAGLLSAMGIGGSLVEAVVPILRPAALAVGLVLAVILAASLVARRARRRTCPDCARPVQAGAVPWTRLSHAEAAVHRPTSRARSSG